MLAKHEKKRIHRPYFDEEGSYPLEESLKALPKSQEVADFDVKEEEKLTEPTPKHRFLSPLTRSPVAPNYQPPFVPLSDDDEV